ncbi:MAG: RDD family protein [Cyanobacteria bacterium Co-bin13]|nr:RDD family protein [Cyanobacteria bacterium Co-bin13]
MGLFNTITIRTPESVELDFTLAGIGSRAVALLIDYTILALALLTLLLLWLFLAFQLADLETFLNVQTETLQLWLVALFSVSLFALYIGYFVGFETGWYGQTPGKRFAKIRVIRDDAQPERLFQATLRSLLRPIDDILFIGFFCILLSPREKRLGDWLAGTLVVQIDPNTAGHAIAVEERSRAIAADLLNLADFTKILPDDFATVRDYLQRRPGMTEKARGEVSLHLAQRLRDQLDLASLPTEMTADTFLEALYWGYQQQAADSNGQLY